MTVLSLLGVVVLLGVLGLIIQAAVVGAGAPPKKVSPDILVPSEEDGPGHYLVVGVDRESKLDTSWVVQAESRANALVKADLEGIIVTAVSRVE